MVMLVGNHRDNEQDFRPFSKAAYTLSKSSLCVAMGTRATLCKRAQDIERQGGEKRNSVERQEKL